MKPLTNETLIEFEKKLEDYSNGVYYDGDPKRYEGTEKKDLIDFIASALQAKEEDMVETLRKEYPQFVLSEEIKGKYWKEFGSRIYRRSRFLIEKFIDTKLSNLSK